jgi:ATP-dependent RNA helicase DeaD
MNSELGDELGGIAEDSGGFAALGLRAELLQTLTTLGYEEPTPIQREAIPAVLAGRDVLGQAATGTGKTAAFALPVLHRLGSRPAGAPVALVLVPTRELAMQVAEAMTTYGRSLGTRVVAVYGGQPIGRQLGALERGTHVVVATPGRALDHLRRGSLSLDSIETVVLDEADEMLDMGFAEDIDELLTATPEARQTVLFSATLPPRISGIAARHQHQPVTVKVGSDRAPDAPVLVTQRAHIVMRAHKAAALGRVLDVEAPTATIVFCRTRTEVDELTELLGRRGYRAEALHGGMGQEQRDRVMQRMRSGTAELLIATDVAARGLDLDLLTHVVNYDVPSAPEAYVHRIGRVGRAGREGMAITIAEPREQRMLANIERLTRRPIDVEPVPSIAELRARRSARLAAELEAELAAAPQADSDDPVATIVAQLGAQHDPAAVAAAAVRLLHTARVPKAGDDREIPDASRPAPRAKPAGSDRPTPGRVERGERTSRPPSSGERARLYIGLGKNAQVRPGDLVGAIANETDLSGTEIGPILVSSTYSLVGVPEHEADRVVDALRQATIRGKRVTVRRYVEQSGRDDSRERHSAPKPRRRDDGQRPERSQTADRSRRQPRSR